MNKLAKSGGNLANSKIVAAGRMFAVVSAFILLITGCGMQEDSVAQRDTKQGSGGTPLQNSSPEERVLSWQAEYAPLENQYEQAVVADNKIYGCYMKNGNVLLDRIDANDFALEKTFALPDASYIAGIAADKEGNVCLLGSRENEGDMGLWKVDADGKLQDYEKLTLEDTEETDDLSLKGIYTDSQGNLFIWCTMFASGKEMLEGHEVDVWHEEDRVYIKDGQLQTCFYEKIADMKGTKVLNFQVGSDDRPIFVVKDSDGICLQEIDVAQRKRKDAVRLDECKELLEAVSQNSLECIAATDGGFLYCQGSGLFEYRIDTQKAEQILNLTTFGIATSDILFLTKNQDAIEIIDNHGENGPSERILLAMRETEKMLLTLGTIMTSQNLEKAVAEFNRYSSEYEVEITDYYSQAGSYEEALEKLKLDVVTGKAPDIISVGGIDYSMFADKGVLADLYGFMEKDAECSKDMLVQSVVKAYEENGHLYSIAPSFLLHSMWGYEDVIKGKSGVTFDELFQILENSGKDLNSIAGFAADEPVLTRLCSVSMDEFVDWEKGTCTFDGDYFKKVLSFAKEYTGNYTGGTHSERIRNREVVMSAGIISSVDDYQVQKELYGGNIAFIGYPVAEGTGTVVSFMDSDIAINAKKENQAGAWEFVKFYLLQGYDSLGFPVVQEEFNWVMEHAMEEDYFINEAGNTEKMPKQYYNDGSGGIFIYAAAQEDVDMVKALVKGAVNKVESHAVIQNIINEEAEAYFAGQADVDRTAEKIQNRVSLLLQESR